MIAPARLRRVAAGLGDVFVLAAERTAAPQNLPIRKSRACPADHALSQIIMEAKCTKAK